MKKFIVNPMAKQGLQRIPKEMVRVDGEVKEGNIVVFAKDKTIKDSGFYINAIGELVQEDHGGYFA